MIGLDSTFIIDFLRGNENAIKIIERQNEQFAITPINIYEVYLGFFLSKRLPEKIHEFFESLELFEITKDASIFAAKVSSELVKSGKMMEATDIIIASTFLAKGCSKILTKDEAFKRIKGVEVLRY